MRIRCKGRNAAGKPIGVSACYNLSRHGPHYQGETFVVYGSNRWGAGHALPDAKRRFNNHGGRLCDGYAVMVFDGETEFEGIDAFARYHYNGNTPTGTVHPARKTAAKELVLR